MIFSVIVTFVSVLFFIIFLSNIIIVLTILTYVTIRTLNASQNLSNGTLFAFATIVINYSKSIEKIIKTFYYKNVSEEARRPL